MEKCFSFIFVLCLVVVAIQAQNRYTTRYDSIDVDSILSNRRILTNYLKCLMDEGPCTNEGRELKKTLPDALANGCSKCNEKQKSSAEKVIRHLIKNRSNDWKRLTAKYDPSGQYRKKYEAQYNIKA
ncbi:chemosensory protein-related [Holotrichia oblita]|uniref:Chemosensory protein-related n=4 Tax=Scarabaeidae TaxID=7055 RepID=A0ACB9TQH9_HOLOL|nr:chemosensory protein 5 [Anomala corpulenta]KAI4469136.1 chemosensory protein-related [Holotrichia oblita]KAI4469147.1 chemosensory protein-related [Holotrichia oblita]KAI4469156.1 chemosensory protein-related [Holotrichia oblita]